LPISFTNLVKGKSAHPERTLVVYMPRAIMERRKAAALALADGAL
jgi:hypothetical protein